LYASAEALSLKTLAYIDPLLCGVYCSVTEPLPISKIGNGPSPPSSPHCPFVARRAVRVRVVEPPCVTVEGFAVILHVALDVSVIFKVLLQDVAEPLGLFTSILNVLEGPFEVSLAAQLRPLATVAKREYSP
jgi:hypothetical protein